METFGLDFRGQNLSPSSTAQDKNQEATKCCNCPTVSSEQQNPQKIRSEQECSLDILFGT